MEFRHRNFDYQVQTKYPLYTRYYYSNSNINMKTLFTQNGSGSFNDAQIIYPKAFQRNFCLSLLIFMLLLGSGYRGVAQTIKTWTGGAGDGLWSSAANWSSTAIPTADDIATFNTNENVTYDAASPLTIGGIKVTGNSIVTLNSNAARTLNLSNQNSQIDAGSTLNLTGSDLLTVAFIAGILQLRLLLLLVL